MTRINPLEIQQHQRIDGNTTDSNNESDYTVDLDEQYHPRHSQLRDNYISLESDEETHSVQHIDSIETIAKIQQLGHDAKARLERMSEQRELLKNRENELNALRNDSQNQPQTTEPIKKAGDIFNYGDDDLRPKFAILKHKDNILHLSTSTHLNLRISSDSSVKNQPPAKTPSWFFNIPTTRTPFPDFESKLPPEELVD